MAFHDRDEELAALETRWVGGRAELFILWGRRRVGKTELLDRFGQGKPGLLFEPPEGSARDQLGDLSRELAAASGNRLLQEQPLTSWEAALAAVDQWAAQAGRLLIVLDEFQRIVHRTPDIGSVLNRWWRRSGRDSGVFLVLSGSEVSLFQREILQSSATMYGRRTGQLQLRPLRCREAGDFLPEWSAVDRVRAYAICGGMPYYLEQLDPRRSLRDNVHHAVLRRDGVLREEARLLLHQELPEPDFHFSLLRAIAGGCTRVSEMVNRTGLDERTALRNLDLLRSLFLVERQVPVTVRHPERTRTTRYAISDEYLNFWFTFVHPYQSRLERDADIVEHLDGTVMPNLDAFVSRPAFERACQQFVRDVEPVADVGRWWGQVTDPSRGTRTRSQEIDVVGVDHVGDVTVVGSCKWSGRPVGIAEDHLLTRVEDHIGRVSPDVRHYLFSRSGFDGDLQRLAAAQPDRIRLVTPEDLFASPGSGRER